MESGSALQKQRAANNSLTVARQREQRGERNWIRADNRRAFQFGTSGSMKLRADSPKCDFAGHCIGPSGMTGRAL
jgi:hypothetical protein